MFKKLYTHTALSIILIAGGNTGLAHAQSNESVSSLHGYSTLTVSAEFESYLRDNYNLRRALASDDELSEKVLSDKTLQDQLRNGDIMLFELRQRFSENDNGQDVENKGIEVKPNQSARAERNLERARAIIAGEASAKAGAEVAEVAQKRQEALEKLIKDLAEDDPKALALFMQNTQLQQDIIDGAVTIEDAMAQLDVELKEAQRAALATTTAATVEESEETQVADINRIPTAAETELDANGWPKYLNVPEGCQPPQEGISYLHQQSTGDRPRSIGGNGQTNSYYASHPGIGPEKRFGPVDHYKVSPYFKHGGDVRRLGLTGKEVIAAPFFTENYEYFSGRLTTNMDPFPMTPFHMTISYCPGDFDNSYTPEGRPELNCQRGTFGNMTMATMLANNPYKKAMDEKAGNSPHMSKACILEPGERYFINIKHRDPEECERNYGPDGPYSGQGLKRSVNGESLYACGQLFAGMSYNAGAYEKSVPYVNVCKSKGPYPSNYNFKSCGRKSYITSSHWINKEDWSDKEKSDMAYTRKDCYDPSDKLQPQSFVRELIQGEIVWTEGFGKPAYQDYVCEFYMTAEAKQADRPNDNHAVCASHRENQTREVVHTTGSRNQVFKALQQCQFDQVMGRYDWFNISSQIVIGQNPDEMIYRYNGREIIGLPQEVTLDRDQCHWNGQSYSIGTVMTQTTDNGTHKFVCQQAAPKPALPRFVHPDSGHGPLVERTSKDNYSVEFSSE